MPQSTALKSIKSLAPLLDRVLVQRIKADTKTASGIFLPDSAVKELNEAKVLAVGPGILNKEGVRIPLGVAAGDKVLIPQFGGSPIKVGEEEYSLFRDHEYVYAMRETREHGESTLADISIAFWPRSTSKGLLKALYNIIPPTVPSALQQARRGQGAGLVFHHATSSTYIQAYSYYCVNTSPLLKLIRLFRLNTWSFHRY